MNELSMCVACGCAVDDGFPWCFECSGDDAIGSRDEAGVLAEERVIRHTRFRSRTEPVGLPMATEPGELAASLASPLPVGPGGKSALPLVSWATFRGNRRTLANVEAVHALGLDVDDPTADPAGLVLRARDALGGVEVFAHSTASSEPGAYRLRLLIPYDAPANAEEHRASWALVARVLERVGIVVDRACSDASRGFFVPAMPANGVYFHAHHGGAPWPVSFAADVEREKQATAHSLRGVAVAIRGAQHPGTTLCRARAYLAKCEPAIQGANGSRATFVVAAKLVHGFELSQEQAFDLLAEEYNPRCSPPWSERDLRRKVNEAADKGRAFARGSLLERRAS